MKTVLFIFLIFSLSQLSLAKEKSQKKSDLSKDEVQNQIDEIMKRREEMIRSLFNDDSFDSMEKRMQEMMKKFGGNDFDVDRDSIFSDSIVGEYDFKEDEKYKMLSLKVKQIKDRPLDIKIEKGQIKIKGDVEEINSSKNNKNVTKIHFERVFPIPSGVDEKNPEFENKDGELLIKFKKLKVTKATPTKHNDDRVPVLPDDQDIHL